MVDIDVLVFNSPNGFHLISLMVCGIQIERFRVELNDPDLKAWIGLYNERARFLSRAFNAAGVAHKLRCYHFSTE